MTNLAASLRKYADVFSPASLVDIYTLVQFHLLRKPGSEEARLVNFLEWLKPVLTKQAGEYDCDIVWPESKPRLSGHLDRKIPVGSPQWAQSSVAPESRLETTFKLRHIETGREFAGDIVVVNSAVYHSVALHLYGQDRKSGLWTGPVDLTMASPKHSLAHNARVSQLFFLACENCLIDDTNETVQYSANKGIRRRLAIDGASPQPN